MTLMEAIWSLKKRGYEVKLLPKQEKMYSIKGNLLLTDGTELSAKALVCFAESGMSTLTKTEN